MLYKFYLIIYNPISKISVLEDKAVAKYVKGKRLRF